jgi:RNA polymerase nonessential primary-like sigma factor
MNKSTASLAPPDIALANPGDGFEPDSTGSGSVPNSAGTFSLRRARFFAFTETRKDFVSAEQQYALIKLIKESDPGTKQAMIVQNLRMVVNIAKRYTDRGLEFVDLVREGNNGLIHALDKFDPEGDFCFSTFVDSCICQSIERAIMNRFIPTNSLKTTPACTVSTVDGRSK